MKVRRFEILIWFAIMRTELVEKRKQAKTTSWAWKLSLQALGAAGVKYRLQESTNVLVPTWVDVETNTADSHGALSFTDLQTRVPPVFYRMVTP